MADMQNHNGGNEFGPLESANISSVNDDSLDSLIASLSDIPMVNPYPFADGEEEYVR